MATAPSIKAGSRFAAACGMLSRFVRAAERAAEARPVALPLMPGADVSAVQEVDAVGPAPAQMTIFYGGRVLVVDEFPADRAAELVRLAAAAAGAARGNGDVAGDLPMARKASLQRFMEKRKCRLAARGVPYRRQQDGADARSDHITLAL